MELDNLFEEIERGLFFFYILKLKRDCLNIRKLSYGIVCMNIRII